MGVPEIILNKYHKNWLDTEYLHQVSGELETLPDFIPKMIEKLMPNYSNRKQYLIEHIYEFYTEEFRKLQVYDQAGPWVKTVEAYDTFFKKHPEYRKLIKDENAYNDWKINGWL